MIIFRRYGACWLCLCCHNPPNSDIDYRIFIVRTDVNARDCTRGCTDTERESALKVDSGRKISCRTEESKLRRRQDGPMLYQLSYIPSPNSFKVPGWKCLLRGNHCARHALRSVFPGLPRVLFFLPYLCVHGKAKCVETKYCVMTRVRG